MTFGKRDEPCGDCLDGYCMMNCGPASAKSAKSANENEPMLTSTLLKAIGSTPEAKAAVRYGKVRFA